MISREQERLAFLRLELDSCVDVLKKLRKGGPNISGDVKEWEDLYKKLSDEVFELNALMGIDV